jgi:hypothetical protein
VATVFRAALSTGTIVTITVGCPTDLYIVAETKGMARNGGWMNALPAAGWTLTNTFVDYYWASNPKHASGQVLKRRVAAGTYILPTVAGPMAPTYTGEMVGMIFTVPVTSTAPAPTNCVGAWSTCAVDCKKTYVVSKAAANGGAACPAVNGAQLSCTDGACRAKCSTLVSCGSPMFSDAKNTWVWMGKDTSKDAFKCAGYPCTDEADTATCCSALPKQTPPPGFFYRYYGAGEGAK